MELSCIVNPTEGTFKRVPDNWLGLCYLKPDPWCVLFYVIEMHITLVSVRLIINSHAMLVCNLVKINKNKKNESREVEKSCKFYFAICIELLEAGPSSSQQNLVRKALLSSVLLESSCLAFRGHT